MRLITAALTMVLMVIGSGIITDAIAKDSLDVSDDAVALQTDGIARMNAVDKAAEWDIYNSQPFRTPQEQSSSEKDINKLHAQYKKNTGLVGKVIIAQKAEEAPLRKQLNAINKISAGGIMGPKNRPHTNEEKDQIQSLENKLKVIAVRYQQAMDLAMAQYKKEIRVILDRPRQNAWHGK